MTTQEDRPVITLSDAEKIELIGQGARAAEQRIVAWLREDAGRIAAEHPNNIAYQIEAESRRIAAQAIEAGEHLAN